MKHSQTKLKDFAYKLLTSKEEEKKKLSSILHDEVGSIAVDFSLKLSNIEEEIKNKNFEGAMKILAECKPMIKETVANLKNTAAELRPIGLEVIGIGDILKDYLSTVEHTRNIKIDFEDNLKGRKINDNVSITLYRIVQEALNNIGKHSMAKKVQIKLFITRGINIIKLEISDDGKGFNEKRISKDYYREHMGIRTMREMAEILNGSFKIQSTDKGTKINVYLPFKKQ